MPSPRREDRIHEVGGDDQRSRFQRDRDRILYSSAFKRLSSVTQVVAASEGHLFHNRMTHSLKVAQIARRLVVEDFYRAGLIPLDLLGRSAVERDEFFDWVDSRWSEQDRGAEVVRVRDAEIRDAFAEQLGVFAVLGPYRGSRDQRAQLRQNTALVIADLVTNTVLKEESDPGDEVLDMSAAGLAELVRLLKELVWYYVIERPALATQQAGKSKIVETVFEAFHEAVFQTPPRMSLLPGWSQDELELLTGGGGGLPLDHQQVRVVADSVASLGEDEIVRLYGRLTGHELGSVLEHVT